MKFAFVLLLACILGSFNQAIALEVFSMNLHCALGDWKDRTNVIIREISRRQPDVIGLQEICNNRENKMTSYILSELRRNGYEVKSWDHVETHRSFLSYQEELLIISRHVEQDKIKGSLPSLKFFENNYLGLKIDGIWFVTTHLHFALPAIRKKQYITLNRVFQNKDAIVFGDMNSHPGNKESTVFHQNNWSPLFNGPTYPSKKPSKIFDGFWTSKSMESKVFKTDVEILFTNTIPAPSDHLGVYLNMELQ